MQKAEEKLPEEIQTLVDRRAAARKEKRWADSDSLRDQLKEKGYIVEDTAQGQKVRRQIQ
jgi:cysteinyl-tRNA synthetase